MEHIQPILNSLYEAHPDAHCELNYTTPFELLIATVLSAQTTDKKVNAVTAKLFKEFNTPEAFASMQQMELEERIREIGLYKNKAKHVISLSNALIQNFGGQVPADIAQLMTLDGVGKKTANVVVSNAFGIPAIAVDTHVFRVSNRIGLADSNTVEGVENQLMERIPKEDWCKAHHAIIFHGRRVCTARKPSCPECCIKDACRSFGTV